jgi:regulator of sigma E protease
LITAILSTIVVLGVLIFVHELGHFLVARRMGVTVLRFSFGFGPKIFGFQRGDTEYRVSLIPLGGYVKMLGEDPEEGEENKERPDSFSSQPVYKRMAIVAAGPFSNFALAIVIFAFLYALLGIPHLTPQIGAVTPDSPAEQAGIQPGDKVVSLNGRPITQWDELSEGIADFGEAPINLGIQRGQENITVQVKPQASEITNIFGEKIKRPVIGIAASQEIEVEKVNPLLAGYYSLQQTYNLSKLFLLTIVKLIQRVLPMETLGGPILIAQMAGQQAQEGLVNLINFIAIISVNLGVLNLLPIPILDGGHLLFFSIEAIRKRPIALRKVELAQRVGMVLLLILMVFVFYNDIMRLIPGGKGGLPMP